MAERNAPRIIAVVPARGGSKRIPGKNIKSFNGKPMILWPLSVMAASGLFQDIFVSTDDEEIAAVAEAAGFAAPFRRPEHLADDHAPTNVVTKHAAEWYLEHRGPFDLIATVYPSAVLLDAGDLHDAVALQQKSDCALVISACAYPAPIQRAFYPKPDGGLAMFQPEHYYSRSQDLTPAFHDAGQFYVTTREAALAQLPAIHETARMLPIPRTRVVDIDTPDDFDHAELIARATSLAP